MNRQKHSIALHLVKGLNIVLITTPFALCWYLYYATHIGSPFYNRGNWLMIALFIVGYTIFARVYDAFLVSLNRISEMVYSQILAICITDGFMYIIIALLSKRFPNILPGVLALVGQVFLSILWCLLSHRWYFSVYPPKKTYVVYDFRQGMEELIYEYGMKKKFNILDTMDTTKCLADINVLQNAEAVFLSGVRSHERNIILKYCVEHSIDVYVIPRIGDVLMMSASKLHMLHLPILRLGRYNPHPEYLLAKRLMDILVSAVALIITSPILIITAIAIKATDHGPVFYKQTRLTKDRKEFEVLKFRSMRVDAEKDGVARLSTGDKDDRITPVGRVIRKVRIDELPQLINILVGDMSIVGPRPERPEIAAEYEKELPEFALRLQAKAGLTGLGQVYGKYNTTPYDKLQMDLAYIANASIFEDLRIILATIKIIFLPESTEGVAAGQTTAMNNENDMFRSKSTESGEDVWAKR